MGSLPRLPVRWHVINWRRNRPRSQYTKDSFSKCVLISRLVFFLHPSMGIIFQPDYYYWLVCFENTGVWLRCSICMYVPNWHCQSQKSCHFLLVRFNEKSPAIARGRLFLRIEFGSIECEQSENKEKLNWARFSLGNYLSLTIGLACVAMSVQLRIVFTTGNWRFLRLFDSQRRFVAMGYRTAMLLSFMEG